MCLSEMACVPTATPRPVRFRGSRLRPDPIGRRDAKRPLRANLGATIGIPGRRNHGCLARSESGCRDTRDGRLRFTMGGLVGIDKRQAIYVNRYMVTD